MAKKKTEQVRKARFIVEPNIWYENCLYSVMETLAIGKPVIGANIAGIPELVILNQIAFHEKQISNSFIKLLIKRTASILCKLYGFKRFVKKTDNLSKKYNNSEKMKNMVII